MKKKTVFCEACGSKYTQPLLPNLEIYDVCGVCGSTLILTRTDRFCEGCGARTASLDDEFCPRCLWEDEHFRLQDEGSILLLHPLTDEAREWLQNTAPDDAQFLGDAMAVQPGYIQGVFEAWNERREHYVDHATQTGMYDP